MIIDICSKCKISLAPITIKGSEVERVEEYTYLGVIIDNNLKFGKEIHSVEKRLKPRLYCLRKLNSLMVNTDILAVFYNSVVCGVWMYCVICWPENTDKGTFEVLARIIRRAVATIGAELSSVDIVYEEQVCVNQRAIFEWSQSPIEQWTT